MALISRLKTWVAGDTLTASDLNGEFNNILNDYNGNITTANVSASANIPFSKLDSTTVASVATTQTITGAKTFSGADTLILPTATPTASNSLASVNNLISEYDGTAVRTYVPFDKKALGAVYNLDITYASNTLSVTGNQGTALASTNAAYIVVPDTTAGKVRALAVTAAQTINDAGNAAPQLLGRWGTTASVAWGSALPLYIYAVNKDNTATNLRFALARFPHYTTTPSSTNNIGIAGTAPTSSSQTNFVLLGTAANTGYNSVPCVCIGSLQATCDASAGGSWTFGALSAGRDGIGLFQKGVAFTNPQGQNGNDSGKLFTRSGGTTALAFTTQVGTYWVSLDGWMTYQLTLVTRTANGAGGTTFLANMPAATVNTTNLLFHGPGEGTINNIAVSIQSRTDANTTSLKVQSSSGNLADSSFANANDYIETNITFPIQ